jgi:hypothetical protein
VTSGEKKRLAKIHSEAFFGIKARTPAEALFLGKGQQLAETLRCLSLQGVGLVAF